MADKTWTVPEILNLSSTTWTSCALQAAVNLDVFSALDREAGAPGGRTVTDLAAALSLDRRALAMLVTALVALNFITREGEELFLTDFAARYLSKKSPDYLGFIIKHQSHILPGWARLAEAVRTGGPVRQDSSSDTEDEGEREDFLMGMFNIARQQAETVAAGLDLTGRHRLLDLGGGPGTYAVYFCRQYPSLQATVFDLPTSEKFARQVAARYGLAERVAFTGGDFLKDPLPQGFDVVWLSQVLHGENPEDAAKLVARGAEVLDRGGLLAVQEFILADDGHGPAQPALFSLNMLVGTSGGQAYTEGEIKAMMTRAGAGNIRRLDLALPPGCGILVGEKA